MNMPSGAIHLSREVRFSIDRDWVLGAHGAEGFEHALPVTNSWGGWPSAVGIAPYLTLRIEVSGVPDATTGYLVNIRELDLLMRRHAIPLAARLLDAEGVRLTGFELVRGVRAALAAEVPGHCRLEALRLSTTPFLSYAILESEPNMVELTQSFEFSASHRLHVPALSDEDNRRIFGKCNNPRGHGHNYQLEVTIADSGNPVPGLPLPEFEARVKRAVIDRLDHKHLNEDVPEFAKVNPSVENIAQVVWGLLGDQLRPAKLRRVRVWETAKTYAEYSGA